MSLSLLPFWPTEENVLACIKSEAESLSNSVFMSVHQPMKFLRRNVSGKQKDVEADEKELFRAFMQRTDTGTVVLPIIGSSGIGKSHMIYRLHLELLRRRDADKLHIIRIPKSASLKSILQLIIKDLKVARYDEIRREIEGAREHLSRDRSVENFQTELRRALLEKYDQAKREYDELRHNGLTAPDDLKSILEHCALRSLPALLQETELHEHFIRRPDGGPGVLALLVNRAMAGDKDTYDKEYQFSENDLKPDQALALRGGVSVQTYYRNLMSNPGFIKGAVLLLNSVVDQAMHQLLELGENRLVELFTRIRRLLMEEDKDKELILLVEDFAALAGVQGAFLDVMIKEAFREGRQELCVMRTALAVTHGYLINLDTVRTRYKTEWQIQDRPFQNDEDAVEAITQFIGSYLNAARFGADNLEARYRENQNDSSVSWPPKFDVAHLDGSRDALTAEGVAMLDAFGYSSHGYPLFPYNMAAIEELAELHLRETGNLKFNPRTIINFILRKTLDLRDDFLAGQFPPGNFHDFQHSEVHPRIRTYIQEVFRSEKSISRHLALQRFWGGSPRTESELFKTPQEIYRSFGMEPIVRKGKDTTVEERETPEPAATTTPQENPEDSKTRRKIEEWERAIRSWAKREDLKQVHARNIRGWITEALDYAFDWDRCLLAKKTFSDSQRDGGDLIFKNWVFIPGAPGGTAHCTADNAFVSLGHEEDRGNRNYLDRMELTLMAFVKYHDVYQTWDYPDAENDYPYYAEFVEEACLQARDFLNRRYFGKQGETLIVPLAGAMLFGAQVLGTEGAFEREKVFYLNAALKQETMEVEATDGADDSGIRRNKPSRPRWEILRQKCIEAITSPDGRLPSIRDSLLKLVGARQNGAATVYAVDSTVLLKAMATLKDQWPIRQKLEQEMDAGPVGEGKRISDYLRYLDTNAGSALQERWDDLRASARQYLNWLGRDFQMRAFQQSIRTMINTARNKGLLRAGQSVEAFLYDLDRMQGMPVKEILGKLLSIADSEPGSLDLRRVAELLEEDLVFLKNVLSKSSEFIEQFESRLQADQIIWGNVNINATRKKFEEELACSRDLLESLNQLKDGAHE